MTSDGDVIMKSPAAPNGEGPPTWAVHYKSGDEVEIFTRTYHDMAGWVPALEPEYLYHTPRIGFTESWVRGRVTANFNPDKFQPQDRTTHVQVRLHHEMWFNRAGEKVDMSADMTESYVSFSPDKVRKLGSVPAPKLSLLVVRWGGQGRVEPVTEGDSGWGATGSVASDTYINQFLDKGVHNTLGTNYEVLTVFIAKTADLAKLAVLAPMLKSRMRGEHKAALYFLWPVEWDDDGDPRYAGYVGARALMNCIRDVEAAGIQSRFPHNHGLYEVVGGKLWQSYLCTNWELNIPATTRIQKVQVRQNCAQAAKDALSALRCIKAHRLHAQGRGNEDPNVKKGVVKLGWSWEATDVWVWDSEARLQEQLEVAMSQVGNHTGQCFVQEWIDMDFEMRLYAVDVPSEIPPGTLLEPKYYVYNRWNRIDHEGKPREFEKLNRERVLKEVWVGDETAVRAVERKTCELMTKLLVHLRSEHAEPPVVMRFDFMVKRTAPGVVDVRVGELTELGACMLGWKEGPLTVWDAVIRSCMRDGTGSAGKALKNGYNY